MEQYNFEDRKQFEDDILKLLERGSSNDVKIKLSDGEINANKDILMIRCEYFNTMFDTDKFLEGETNTVDMSHCSKAIMEKIIKFLFTGAVMFDDLSLAQLVELSHISEMLLLKKFQEEVDWNLEHCKIQERGADVKNLPDLILALRDADQYNLEHIKSWLCDELHCELKGILSDVKSSDTFKTLPFKLMREILLFVHSSCVNIDFLPTTKQKLDSFMIWLSNNKITEKQKGEIVESFKFDDFTVDELMTSIRDSGLYRSNKIDERVRDLFKEQGDRLQEKDKLLMDQEKLLKDQGKVLKDKEKKIKAQEKMLKDYKRKRIMDDFRV